MMRCKTFYEKTISLSFRNFYQSWQVFSLKMADVAIIDGSGGDYLVPPNKIEEVDQVTIRPDKQLPNETKVSPEIVHQTYQICNKLATTPTLTTLAHPERSKHILYANDRVAKFSDEGQLLFGFVSINRVTKDTRIDWDNGKEEKLSYTGGKGIALKAKVIFRNS